MTIGESFRAKYALVLHASVLCTLRLVQQKCNSWFVAPRV